MIKEQFWRPKAIIQINMLTLLGLLVFQRALNVALFSMGQGELKGY